MRCARRLTYADARMRNLLLTLLRWAVIAAKLCGPGGVRAVMAENLLLKQQLIVLRRARRRAPNLSQRDRLLCGFWSLFLSQERIRKVAISIRPSTISAFQQALVRRKYLWSAKMMHATVSASCRLTGHLIFMMQPVQHRRCNHTTVRGKPMAGWLRPDR